MPVQYSVVGSEGEEFLTAFSPEYDRPQVIHSTHPNYQAVKDALTEGDTPEASLFDPAETVREAFEALTERVSVKGGTVYLDGDPIDTSLTKAILRFLQEGEGDWQPLVNFFEKVQSNPSESAREGLYTFLAKNDYSITRSGDIVGYKAVRFLGDGETYVSINSGAFGDVQVNGIDADAAPKQQVGDTVTMARSKVDPDASTYCSVGLHVAAFPYAESFGGANGTKLRVLVNPRDVVAVPGDSGAQKVRVCRYVIDAVVFDQDDRVLFEQIGEITSLDPDVAQVQSAMFDAGWDDDDDDEDLW